MTAGTVRGRRLVGLGILLLTIVGAVAANRVIVGERVTGRPVADWPQPPPVGSCLDLPEGDSRTVPCGGPHDAEVIEAFDALDPAPSGQSTCALAARGDMTPVGVPSAAPDSAVLPEYPEWRVPRFSYSVRQVDAPPDQRAGRYGWVACAIQPQVPVRYTGVLVASTGSAPPAAYRTCLDDRGAPASCLMPHTTEVLAVVQRQVTLDKPAGAAAPSTSPLSAPISDADIAAAQHAMEIRAGAERQLAATLPAWNEQCLAIAAALLGTSDPTYGGTVTIEIPSAGTSDQYGASVNMAPDNSMFSMQGTCVVAAPEGGMLTDSMVDWGDKPPPLTG